MEKQKKTGMILRIILFSVVFLILFQNLSLLFVFKGGETKLRLRGFYQEPKNSIDTVIIGPSSVYPFFIPGYAYNKHGLVAYNYAIPALKLSTLKYAIAEVKNVQNPALYVIDIRTAIYEKSIPLEADIRRMVDNMKLGSTKLDIINHLVDMDERISYYLGIIKYHERWKELNDTDYDILMRKTDPSKGYDARTKISRQSKNAWLSKTLEKEPLSEENENIIRELLTYCKENNINALFTAAPWCMDESRKKRLNFLKDVVEEYGYTFLDANDYYEELGWDFDTDMGDKKHSNIQGATKYTKFLSNYLMEHYNLEDRRQDPKYEEWEQSYNLYLQSYAVMQKKLKAIKTNYFVKS